MGFYAAWLSDANGINRINIRIGYWRIITVLILSLGAYLFYSREPDWLLFLLASVAYSLLWLPLQGRHMGENPNLFTYIFMVCDVSFFLWAANLEHDILNSFSVLLILPLFQYLLRYGRKASLVYVSISIVAMIYICLFHYRVHLVEHFLVVLVMIIISCNEGLLVQENNNLRKQLLELAIHDELTGLKNFRFLGQVLGRELNLANRHCRNLSFLLVDIDYFKEVNDQFGHDKGNEVLQSIAAIINQSIRKTDYAARFGGEEFAVVLPETAPEKAVEIAERLRRNVEEFPFDIGSITISIGVSANLASDTNEDKLIKQADEALYKAKRSGRNRVEVATA